MATQSKREYLDAIRDRYLTEDKKGKKVILSAQTPLSKSSGVKSYSRQNQTDPPSLI